MPFHGDYKRLRLHAQLAEAVGVAPEDIFQGENGLPLDIDERRARFGKPEPAGMIFVDGMHQSPLAFLLMTAAFRAMDPALEESALMSGATVPQIARRVTLKLAWPAALAALLILFVRAVESFEVPALLGIPVGIEVYTSSIYQAIQRYPSEVGLASAYAVSLLLITSLCIYAQSRVAAEVGKFSTVTGKGYRPRMMNIVLSGANGEAEAHFKVPGRRVVAPDDLMLYSLEITGAEGYWVEFSRALIQGRPSPRTEAMKQAYPEALEAARKLMRDGEPASAVHRVVAETFARHGFALGHLSGHSIGLTMLEHPAIGANTDVVLRENMVLSLHPQVVDRDGQVCLYAQDTYRVGKTEGENLCDVPWRFFDGSERKAVSTQQSALR